MEGHFKESELIFEEKPTHWNFQDLTGQRFGRLVVLGFAGKNLSRASLWFCECDCGNITKATAGHFKIGHTTSCGCFNKERVKETQTTHGYSTRNSSNELRTYRTWESMLRRCHNLKDKRFNDYGGRGIKVCERWHQFENFLADMGERPKGKTLDRIENDKGYRKENCRWATIKEQNNNTRRNHFLTYNGKTQTLAQWSEELGFKKHTIFARLNYGWSVNRTLTTPIKTVSKNTKLQNGKNDHKTSSRSPKR